MNITHYRRQFALYHTALEQTRYEYQAELKTEFTIEPLIDRYGELFSRASIEKLRLLYDETPEFMETERAGVSVLCGAACLEHLQWSVRELTEEIMRCESSAQIAWGKEQIPLELATARIAREQDAARRRELAERLFDACASCDDLRAARLEAMRSTLHALGYDSYKAFRRDLAPVDDARLLDAVSAFLQCTESVYSATLDRLITRELPHVQLTELHYGDYLYLRHLSRFDSFFPAQDLLQTYRASLNDLGIGRVEQGNIQLEEITRPLKGGRAAACFGIQPPENVKLLVNLTDGMETYLALFAEAGRAQFFAWTSEELVKRHPEFLRRPDQATERSYALLFHNLFLDPVWLHAHRPNLTERRAHQAMRDVALWQLFEVRRDCAKLSCELALAETSKVRSEQLAMTYVAAYLDATQFHLSPKMFLTDADENLDAATRLRAAAFEVGLREHLRTRYGRRWWASRKACDELIDLWNTASRYTVEELAKLIGFGEISFELLAEMFFEALKEE
jgi:hypothetical protein